MPAPVWTIRKREKLTCIYPRNDQYTFLLETHLILNASFYLILILFYFIFRQFKQDNDRIRIVTMSVQEQSCLKAF